MILKIKRLPTKSIYFLAASLVILVLSYAAHRPSASLSANDWRAGNIISDSIFYNNKSMSTRDIQNFLNKKNPNCDTWGKQPAKEKGRPDISHAEYARINGLQPPPYVCLKDYYQVPKEGSIETNQNPSLSKPKGSISAAEIIKRAADKYGVNPKVIIVLIQKESYGPLIVDDWPLNWQYNSALGYGCPDTAACDQKYKGFYNQVMNAARQIKLYKDNPNSYRHKPFTKSDVYYNPDLGRCSKSSVYLESRATAGLYNYTPYQPNRAALNNLYGTGDNCSAYGNRNFWRIFNDWFGSTGTVKPNYSWSPISQSVYSDTSRTHKLPHNTSLAPSQTAYVTIKVKNTGSITWQKDFTRLATGRPNGRKSEFKNNSWSSHNRPAVLEENAVKPGEEGTFKFSITAPEKTGQYKEYLTIVLEGISWTTYTGLYLPIDVKQSHSIQFFRDVNRSIKVDPSKTKLITGEKIYVTTQIVNNSTKTLPADTRIATTNPRDRTSILADNSWMSGGRVIKIGKELSPDSTTSVNFSIKIPSDIGLFNEKFGLVVDGKYWVEENTLAMPFSTKNREFDILHTGNSLPINQGLSSKDDKHRLVLQGDGNLVLYSTKGAVWASRTVRSGANRLVMQGDGNLVLYSTKGAVWASRTVAR